MNKEELIAEVEKKLKISIEMHKRKMETADITARAVAHLSLMTISPWAGLFATKPKESKNFFHRFLKNKK